jgi:hypothetical protein
MLLLWKYNFLIVLSVTQDKHRNLWLMAVSMPLKSPVWIATLDTYLNQQR